VRLFVYNTENEQITTATLGEYIQLRAWLEAANETSTSIRVFNCKAFSENMSYYFLLGGCGEGDVMAADRGFRTRVEDTGNDKVTRVSRSAYFKSFLLPARDTLTFECHYILCPADECDGYSCEDSTMLEYESSRNATTGLSSARRKRDISNNPALKAGSLLPKVTSTALRLIPQEEHHFIISSNDLIHAEDDSRPSYPRYEHDLLDASQSSAVLTDGLDLMTIGLIAGMSFLAVLLLITLTCTLMVCRRGLLQPVYRPVGARGSPDRSFSKLMQQKSAGAC